jgi:hypothetical protein
LLQSARLKIHLAGLAIILVVVGIGVRSSAAIWRADVWWHKGAGWISWDAERQSLRTISEGNGLIVLGEPMEHANLGITLMFSHAMNPGDKMMVMHDPDHVNVPPGFANVYFMNLSDDLAGKIQKKIHRRLTRMSPYFWQCSE